MPLSDTENQSSEISPSQKRRQIFQENLKKIQKEVNRIKLCLSVLETSLKTCSQMLSPSWSPVSSQSSSGVENSGDPLDELNDIKNQGRKLYEDYKEIREAIDAEHRVIAAAYDLAIEEQQGAQPDVFSELDSILYLESKAKSLKKEITGLEQRFDELLAALKEDDSQQSLPEWSLSSFTPELPSSQEVDSSQESSLSIGRSSVSPVPG